MNNTKYIYFLIFILCGFIANGQEDHQEVVEPKVQTFKDTRVINSHSVETLRKGILDFRIGHRFGNVTGGFRTLYGLENASDVLFEFDYGLSDKFMIGVLRAKGGGPLKQNVSGFFKYKVLSQGSNSPFSAAFVGLGTYSTQEASDRPGVLNFFAKEAHRLSYNVQIILASKVSERLALQVSGSWTFRNNVEIGDQNDLASIGAVFKFQLSKAFALIYDLTVPLSEFRNNALTGDGQQRFYYPMGVGLEWETGGGHVFQINLTNATGIVETDYIPYTTTNWLDGEYRFGFTIGRQFRLR